MLSRIQRVITRSVRHRRHKIDNIFMTGGMAGGVVGTLYGGVMGWGATCPLVDIPLTAFLGGVSGCMIGMLSPIIIPIYIITFPIAYIKHINSIF